MVVAGGSSLGLTMMRFLADMGVSQRVARWLRDQGHDVVHLREEGLHRLPNGDFFAKAIRESRIVLTFDLDFGEILAQARGQKVSVVLFRLKNASTPFVIQRPAGVLPDSEQALQDGAIVVVEDARHRIRRIPLGS